MTYSIQKIAEELKIARKKKGLSQRALSIKTGIPQNHISKIENGVVDLQTSSLIQIARALELELVLIPTHFLPAVQAIQNPFKTSEPIPAYRLDESDDDI
ncbi:MAG: helix-turn-helix transcriptional regulator [Chlamydiota bacterium]